MTPTEKARRSDALYFDTKVTNRRAMCDMIANLEGDMEELRVKNEELRKLVADMWPFVEGAIDDEYCPAPECPFTEPCTENQVCMASSGFHYRMRELEVDE